MNDDNLNTSSDNLTEILGIGQGYAKALNAIGVSSFADFSKYETSEELHRALSEQDVTEVPLWKVQKGDWIGQAGEKAAAQQASVEEALAAEETEMAATSETGPDEGTWRQHAGFSIFFDFVTDQNGEQAWQTRVWQTRTYHDESGGEEKFSGIEPALWANWILDQAGLPIHLKLPSPQSEIEEEPAPEESSAPPLTEAPVEPLSIHEETRIEMIEVKIAEFGPTSDIPEKQLLAQVRFQLAGPDAEKIVGAEAPYRLEVHTVAAENGSSSLVASGRGRLQANEFEYVHRQQFPMPEVGRYEIHCVALLLPPGQMIAYGAGPILNIVP